MTHLDETNSRRFETQITLIDRQLTRSLSIHFISWNTINWDRVTGSSLGLWQFRQTQILHEGLDRIIFPLNNTNRPSFFRQM